VTVAAPPIRVGTRGSRLAVTQTGIVVEGLRAAGVSVEVRTIETEGDRRALDTPWGEGAFVTAIERALLDGQIDVAVHSAKDVPTDEDPRLTIAAFLPRDRAEDVVVVRAGQPVRSLADLPVGARVGTDSPRRRAFVGALRPDLAVHPLHGNVDTRLRRLDAGETDALVLAAAGLRRLGEGGRIAAWLDPRDVPPAPGQGALAVQVRTGDPVTSVVAMLDDPATRRAVLAERRLLAATGGGCRAPLGALGVTEDDVVRLRAGSATPDGTIAVHADLRLDAHDDVGPVLVALAKAAAARARDLGWPTIVVTREPDRAAATVLALVDRGFAPRVVPAIRSAIDLEPAEARELLDAIDRADWVVVTSRTTVAALVRSARTSGRSLGAGTARWAALGAATERALRDAGVAVACRPERATAAALAEAVAVKGGERVLIPGSDLADPALATALARRGSVVDRRVVHRTDIGPASSRPAAAEILHDASRPVAVVLASPSAVRGWLALADAVGAPDAGRAIPAVAIGPTTGAAVTAAGLSLLAEAADATPGAIADATRAALGASSSCTTLAHTHDPDPAEVSR
jgi:hydroxymethylbilane synthase